jgi:hypothetical protein
MSKVFALAGVLALSMMVWVAPTYGRRGVRGTLAVRLQVDHGGPPGRQHARFTIRLRLLVRTAEGVTVVRNEHDAVSGHVFTLGLPQGRYVVSAAALPPEVNPEERACRSSSASVLVRIGRTVDTTVRCTLIG